MACAFTRVGAGVGGRVGVWVGYMPALFAAMMPSSILRRLERSEFRMWLAGGVWVAVFWGGHGYGESFQVSWGGGDGRGGVLKGVCGLCGP